jgi:hypothetical protein
VKDGFVVGFFRAEQVIHNACEFMSCGGDCLGFAELPSDAPKELANPVRRKSKVFQLIDSRLHSL